MKQFILASGEFVTTTGIYRMLEHPEREITLVYGDPVLTFQRKKVSLGLSAQLRTLGGGDRLSTYPRI
jgi:hypothetical protein